jgi:hypothetical protein
VADDLIGAVVEYANAHPSLTDAAAFGSASWLWLGLAPQTQELPYGTITADSATPAYYSPDDGGLAGSLDAITFILSVYSTSRTNCRRLTDLVKATITDAPLAFTGGTLLVLRPGSVAVNLDPDLGPSGEDVWAGVIQFEATVDSTL